MITPFFAVSLRKLSVLSVCTLGLYQIYWFYAHWRQVRAWNDGSDFSPARRTILFFFYCYPLLRRMRALAAKTEGRSRLQAGLLTTGYIAVNLFDVLPGLWAFLSLSSFVFLLPAQACANRLNERLCTAPFDRNESLSAWNWVVVVLGALLLVLSVVAVVAEAGR